MIYEDEEHIYRLNTLRKAEQQLLDILLENIDTTAVNSQYLKQLKIVRAEEQDLIDKLIEERQDLMKEFSIDPLTGLYNRKKLSKIRDIGAVIMCDLDDFKGINDNYGHDMGDKALTAVGQAITQNIRIGDVGVRFGGDEFIIVFSSDILNADTHEIIDKRIHKIAEDVNKICQIPGRPITLSVGVAFNKDGESLQDLMKKADTALYQSKGNGKNQISYYNSKSISK